MTPSEDRPITGLFYRMFSITRDNVMEKVKDEKWYFADFRPSHIGLIHVVGHSGPLSQKEIGLYIGIDPSDVVSAIDALEGHGIVERKRDPQDRRRQLIELTARGEKIRSRLRELGKQTGEEALAPLNKHEREMLQNLLTRVVRYHIENSV